MSHRAVDWAYEQQVANSRQRLVLDHLAYRANEALECWPAQSTIAAWAGLSVRTVRRALLELEQAHLIREVARHRHSDGSLGVKRYRLLVPAGWTRAAKPVDNGAHSEQPYGTQWPLGSAQVAARAGHHGRAESVKEHEQESVNARTGAREAQALIAQAARRFQL